MVDLACAIVSDFDRRNQDRTTYFQYDGLKRSLEGFELEPDPHCEFCSEEGRLLGDVGERFDLGRNIGETVILGRRRGSPGNRNKP